MNNIKENTGNGNSKNSAIDTAIKLGAVAFILYWCLKILSPFIMLILWGAILAVALFPLHVKLTKIFNGSKKLASTIIAIIGIAIVVIPAVQLSASSIDSAQELYNGIESGTLKIHTPPDSIKEWPLVGEKIHAFWSASADDIQMVTRQYEEQLKSLSSGLVSAVVGIGGGIIQFIVSLIIAVVFMAKSAACYQGVSALMTRLMNEQGERTITTTIATIRSVAVGVIGIAVIQSLISGVGLMIAGIPAAGLWAIAILILAIAQLPPILILGPIAAYYFSVADTTSAVIFLIFSIVVSMSDAVLKPIFLGRGMSIPMIVILLGAIGGMIISGIVGLFVGAVALALGYELMMDWIAHNDNTPSTSNND